MEEESAAGGTAFNTEIADDFVLLSPPRGTTVIEEEIVEGNMYLTTKKNHFVELFPGDAGEGYRKSKTRFEEWLEIQEAEGRNTWEPFTSKEEWDLTKWLVKNVGQKSTFEFLKLQIVSKVDVSIYKNKKLMRFY